MGSEKQAQQFKLCMWRRNKPPKCHEMGPSGQPPWEWFEIRRGLTSRAPAKCSSQCPTFEIQLNWYLVFIVFAMYTLAGPQEGVSFLV